MANDKVLDPSRLPGARAVTRMPHFVKPRLATLVEQAPTGGQWLHEVKFDGYRALSRLDNGRVEMYSRNGKDWTDHYRVLAQELARLPVERAMLDGEVVVQMRDGTTDFQALQNRLGMDPEGQPEEGIETGRLVYYVFDLLYLNGYELLEAPLEKRKDLLQHLLIRLPADGHVLYSRHIAGQGPTFFEESCRLGLEGVVSKKAGGRYRPGSRGGDWLKTKCRLEQEFVIGGYTEPAGTRRGFGALLVGVSEVGGLRYVGKVGTGFSDRLLTELGERLRLIEIDGPPFALDLGRLPRGSHWVHPELVAEVAFSEWTRDGDIRHPSFKGLRADKAPAEVVAEHATPVARAAPVQAAPVQEVVVNGVTITHPDKIFWPVVGTAKMDLVCYYESVQKWMLPYVLGRPIAMVRCPEGVTGTESLPPEAGQRQEQGRGRAGRCFFHKHPGRDFPGPFARVAITESGGPATYLTITEGGSLTGLAQMGVLEIHTWGSTWPDIERPDMLVFDLDPDPAVTWDSLAQGARLMKEVLESFGLRSFVKTTGGKGLHVVAPLVPALDWEAAHRFCKAAAEVLVAHAPDRYTATMAKVKREGKVYVDWVRNTRGATSIAPYSTRAKDHPTVSVPLRWTELHGSVRPDTYTMKNVGNRLHRLKGDPWEEWNEVRKTQELTDTMMQAAGVDRSDRVTPCPKACPLPRRRPAP